MALAFPKGPCKLLEQAMKLWRARVGKAFQMEICVLEEEKVEHLVQISDLIASDDPRVGAFQVSS
jgi:hypothetical protein